jgi:hypothetical protein
LYASLATRRRCLEEALTFMAGSFTNRLVWSLRPTGREDDRAPLY